MPLSFLLHFVPPFEADCLSRNTLSEFNFLRPDKERDVKQKRVESKDVKGKYKGNEKIALLKNIPRNFPVKGRRIPSASLAWFETKSWGV